jgi:hypothetical protein
MTASTTKALAGNGSFNLALLPPADRALIEADKTACLIRWKCRGLPEKEKQRLGPQLLAAVPESARPAVVQALKARGSR